MKDVIPPKATWIKNKVKEIDPDTNSVTLENGEKVIHWQNILLKINTKIIFLFCLQVFYKYLVVALGIKVKFEDVSCSYNINLVCHGEEG